MLDAEEAFQKLKPVLGDKVERLWLEYQLNPKRRAEIEGFLQLLIAKHLGRQGSASVLLDPPPAEESLGEYQLGTVLYGERECGPFGLRQHEWIQHVAIFGRTGSGKTNVGFLIAKRLLDAGVPILVFDWKRNYRDLLQTFGPGRLKVFTVGRQVAPFAFNPLIPPAGTTPSVWLKKLIEIMCHVYWLGEGVAYLLQQAIDAIYVQFGMYGSSQPDSYPTLADVKEWLSKAKVKGRESQWMESAKRAIGTLCYGDISAVVNARHTPDLRELLESNAVLELDALTNADKTFLIEAMLLWIHHYRLQEQSRETFKHAIIIEEAHHILLKREGSKDTIMDVILREIRELGESIILIDQHPSLISVPSLGNTYCTIAMNLKHGRDVSTIANAMLLSPDDKESLGRLPVGDGIVRLQGRWYKPFLVRFPLLLKIEKGKVTDTDLASQIQPDSRPSGEIRLVQPATAEIPQIRAAEKLSKEEIELLKDVMENITSPVVERYRRLGFSAHFGTKRSQSLISKGLIDPVSINLGGGRRIRMLWLSEKGRAALMEMGIAVPPRGRGGPEHEYWKARVAEHLRSLGYSVEVEKSLGGGKAIDLVARKEGEDLAVEIETGNSDAHGNVMKCMSACYKSTIIVCTSQASALRLQHDTLRSACVVTGPEFLTRT